MGDIAALILAADRGVDFATAAALQVFRGRPLLQSSLERVGHWPVDRTVVVLGADEEEVMDTLDFGNCTVVIDPEWQEGSASPLRAGLDHLLREVGISTVILADVSQVGGGQRTNVHSRLPARSARMITQALVRLTNIIRSRYIAVLVSVGSVAIDNGVFLSVGNTLLELGHHHRRDSNGGIFLYLIREVDQGRMLSRGERGAPRAGCDGTDIGGTI